MSQLLKPAQLAFLAALALGGCSKSRRLDKYIEAAHVNGWPATVPEAVISLRSTLSSADLNFIAQTPLDRLDQFDLNLGVDIRNGMGLWNDNRALLTACDTDDADLCSMTIIETLWEELQ